jgi:hypothetical protein
MFEALWFIAVCFPLMFGGPYGKDFDPRSYHWSTTAKCSQAVLPVQALPLRACASPEDLWHPEPYVAPARGGRETRKTNEINKENYRWWAREKCHSQATPMA